MPRYFQLPSALAFNVSGRDSERYLNARLTNDMKSLAVGSFCQAAMLSPQGKTFGLFQVLRTAKESFLLISDAGDAAAVEAQLKKYIVADRVSVESWSTSHQLFHVLELESGQRVLQEINGQAMVSSEHEFCSFSDSFAFTKKRSRFIGVDFLVGPQITEKLNQLLNFQGFIQISKDETEKLRITGGIPSFPLEINEEHLFSESGLQQAISFKKGCYVGQEVMEKIDSMGKAPKVLKLIRMKGRIALSSGDEVLSGVSDLRAIGKAISSCYDDETDATYAFVTLRNSALQETNLTLKGEPAEIVAVNE